MKRACAVPAAALLFALGASTALAQQDAGISAYHDRVDVQPDGSAHVTIDATVSGWKSNTVDLPSNLPDGEGFSVASSGSAATIKRVKVGDTHFIRIRFAHVPTSDVQLKIAFTSGKFFDWKKTGERDAHTLAYVFSNTTTTTIANYQLRILVPPGYKMEGITSSTPRATGEEVVPPYDFTTEDGHLAVDLRSKSVAAGKTAAIAFDFLPMAGSPWPAILIGLAVILASLYLKRDVLTREDYAPEVVA